MQMGEVCLSCLHLIRAAGVKRRLYLCGGSYKVQMSAYECRRAQKSTESTDKYRVIGDDFFMADKRRIFSIDLESFSDVDLAKCGVYRYVEGDFHILLFAYAFDDEEAKIVAQSQKKTEFIPKLEV